MHKYYENQLLFLKFFLQYKNEQNLFQLEVALLKVVRHFETNYLEFFSSIFFELITIFAIDKLKVSPLDRSCFGYQTNIVPPAN